MHSNTSEDAWCHAKKIRISSVYNWPSLSYFKDQAHDGVSYLGVLKDGFKGKAKKET